MIKVLIYVESRYKVNRKRMKKAVGDTLSENSVTSSVEISIAVVGDRKMRALNKKYRNMDKTTNVLSFPIHEISRIGEKGIRDPNATSASGVSRLGDIIISYPQVIRESVRDEMLVDDKIDQLLKHSMLHLLGIHHE